MPPKQKLSVSSVIGKIIVFAEDGEKIGQWGGTECCLSRETGVGPCLVVRSSKHKRGQGTLFKLVELKRVHAMHASQGKLSVVIGHMKRMCTVCISTTESIKQVEYMSGVLQQRNTWDQIERDVLRPNIGGGGGSGGGGRTGGADGGGGSTINHFGGAEGVVQFDDETGGVGGLDPENEYHEMVQVQPAPTAQVASNGATLSATVTLTSEQQLALNKILDGSSVFVTGSAGCGKSEWLQHVISRLPQDDSTVVTASTGIAARRIGGTTVHSFAGIGLGDGTFDEVLSRVKARPEVVRSWTRCRRWIIDEIGMIPGPLFTLLDNIGRAVKRHTTDPFGGIQMILVGDFLQLPPVQQDAQGNPMWCFDSPAWRGLGLKSIQFTKSFRHQSDAKFDTCLRDVRMGEYSGVVEETLKSCLNRELQCGYGVVPTRIMALNTEVDRFNEGQLARIDAPFERYFCEDVSSVPGIDLNSEVSLADVLTLKEGAQVILLAPIPQTKLRNGDTGIVVGFMATSAARINLPIVRFTSGEEQLVDFASMEVRGRGGMVLASRRQLPLRLGWALTVHRTQGMTIPFVEMSLNTAFFEFGQAYTALSRVRRAEHLRLLEFDPSVIKAHPKCIDFMLMTFPLSRQERERLRLVKEQQASRLAPVNVNNAAADTAAPEQPKQHVMSTRRTVFTMGASSAANVKTPSRSVVAPPVAGLIDEEDGDGAEDASATKRKRIESHDEGPPVTAPSPAAAPLPAQAAPVMLLDGDEC